MPNEDPQQRPKTRQMPLPHAPARQPVPPKESRGVVQLDQPEQAQQSEPPVETAEPAGNWHRFHYPIGVFLVAYGTAGVLLLVIGWGDRHREMATYLSKTIGPQIFGLSIATPTLLVAKLVEVLLTLLALAGLMRRRDVWYLPALFGWIGGFAAFCVLDLWSGRFGGLAEHVLYLLGFLILLAVSFTLGVKVRVSQAEQGPIAPAQDRPASTRMQLTKTQEMALAALNRWQRTTTRPH
jgi:hypothetical protein